MNTPTSFTASALEQTAMILINFIRVNHPDMDLSILPVVAELDAKRAAIHANEAIHAEE